ncbi:hypothetical protein EYS00_14265 [Alteromonas sp. KUL49]|nr:hypothetical protein EYS00_14265 [Alteromonas sp. KUL49]
MILLLGLGITLFFVGSLISALTAIGNKQHIFGIATILFLPLSLIYCALNWKTASYSGKLVYSGFAVCLAGYLCFALFYGGL